MRIQSAPGNRRRRADDAAEAGKRTVGSGVVAIAVERRLPRHTDVGIDPVPGAAFARRISAEFSVDSPGLTGGSARAKKNGPLIEGRLRFAGSLAWALTDRRSKFLPVPASPGLLSLAAAGCRARLRPCRPGPQ